MEEHSVLVAGAGPVGLAHAIELGTRGIDVCVVDGGDGTVAFPAGEAIFSRTMEHLRRWGVADEARTGGAPPIDYPHRIAFMTTATGRLLTVFDNHATNGDPGDFGPYTPEGPAFLSKFSFLPLLQRTAESLPGVDVQYGQNVVGVEQDADGVTVEVQDQGTGTSRKMRGAYLVGCDGGRSFVRRHLDIDFVGDFAQGRNFAVHFRAPELRDLLRQHADGLAAQIQTLASASRPYITVVDGVTEWRLSVYVAEEPTMDDAVRWVHEAVGAEIEIEILRAQPWSGHRVVAERYRDGRVFLAGDAAHLLWPKGGFGANTGIGDAVDLGWKLAAVLSGWGKEALLDSYEVERRPIAVRNVSDASSNWTSDAQIAPDPRLDQDDDDGAAARARMGTLIQALRGREFRSNGVQLGYRYRDSPIVVPDGSIEPPDQPDEYVPSTWPGCRAPHVWLPDGTSTLDHFGRGLTLVDTEPDVDLDEGGLVTAARRRGVPFEVLRVSTTEMCRVFPTRFTLVRPDGHVCWRGDELPGDFEAVLDAVRGALTMSDRTGFRSGTLSAGDAEAVGEMG